MKLVTGDQVRALDQAALEAGTPTSVLMENAGLAVAQDVWMALGTLEERRIVVLVGPGNNGGDGLVAARHLHDWGARVEAHLLVQRAKDDPNYRQLVERGMAVSCVDEDGGLAALEEARAAFTQLGDRNREAQVLGNLGGLCAGQGDREMAKECLQEAASLFADLGDEQRHGETLLALGVQQWKSGDRQEGLLTYQTGLETLKKPSVGQKALRSLLNLRTRLLGSG